MPLVSQLFACILLLSIVKYELNILIIHTEWWLIKLKHSLIRQIRKQYITHEDKNIILILHTNITLSSHS